MTDNLADIIQIIHLGQRSGMLTVERNHGIDVEEGFIIFIHGSAIEAKIDDKRDMTAFNYLNTWRKCRFAFVSNLDEKNTISEPSGHSPYPKSGNPAQNTSTAYVHPTTPAVPTEPSDQNGRSPLPPPGPVRLSAGNLALQHSVNSQFPRTLRRLLLLLDGKRTKGELARLLVRNLGELQTMLDDLERMGLIQQ